MNNPSETGEAIAALISDAFETHPGPISERIIANRVRCALPAERLTTASITDSLPPMSDEQAKAYGKTQIQFGKYSGQEIDSVPLDYMIWLADQSRDTWRLLHSYLNSPRIKAELESQPE